MNEDASTVKKYNPDNPMGLSRTAENLMVLTLCLVFGFVMFDRFALTNMATYVMADLNIDYQGLGVVTSAFAISWSIAGYVGGIIADVSRSKKKILLICVLVFSILSLSTGFAGGIISLALIRFMMGIVEGPVLPVNQTIMINESTPSRRGLNQGLMQVSAVGLVSSLLGPIICVALAQTVGWRGAFYITIIPGLIICVMIWFLVKEPVIRGENVVEKILPKQYVSDTGDYKPEPIESDQPAAAQPEHKKASVKEALLVIKNRNVMLAVFACIFILYWYLNTLTFTSSFLVNDKGFDPTTMSIIMAFFGVGAIFWGAVLPKLSDKIGRKPAICIGAVLAITANLGMMMSDSVPVICFFCFLGWAGASVSGMFQGTVPSESVDPKYSTTALGLVQLVGELVGGGLGGILAGWICNTYSISTGFITMIVSILIVIPIALCLKESAPAVVAKRAAKAAK